MTAHVIIIGRNPENRLADDAMSAQSLLPMGPCTSPNCEPSTAVQVFMTPNDPAIRTALAADADGYAMLLDDSPHAKPAEAYVLCFDDRAAAVEFLRALPRQRLMNKMVLLVDSDKPKANPRSKGIPAPTVVPAAPKARAKAKRAPAKTGGQ